MCTRSPKANSTRSSAQWPAIFSVMAPEAENSKEILGAKPSLLSWVTWFPGFFLLWAAEDTRGNARLLNRIKYMIVRYVSTKTT